MLKMAKQDIFKVYDDAELTASEIVVAKFKHADELLVSKRVCAFYPATTNKDKMANSGLKLVYQRLIREEGQVRKVSKKLHREAKR